MGCWVMRGPLRLLPHLERGANVVAPQTEVSLNNSLKLGQGVLQDVNHGVPDGAQLDYLQRMGTLRMRRLHCGVITLCNDPSCRMFVPVNQSM